MIKSLPVQATNRIRPFVVLHCIQISKFAVVFALPKAGKRWRVPSAQLNAEQSPLKALQRLCQPSQYDWLSHFGGYNESDATLVTELFRLEMGRHQELIWFVVAPSMTESIILDLAWLDKWGPVITWEDGYQKLRIGIGYHCCPSSQTDAKRQRAPTTPAGWKVWQPLQIDFPVSQGPFYLMM